jgi:uncharacterized protein YhjY with autotransporter beta-barrel domain
MFKFSRARYRARTSLLAAVAASAFSIPYAHADSQNPGGSTTDAGPTEPSPQIVIANPGTSTTARDPVNVNGVGQMVVDLQNGFIGLCSGTLINPRTALFAAHCVNGRDASVYGANTGGMPISFGLSNYNLPGLQRWFNSGPFQHETDAANFLYNVNYVAYNTLSLDPGAQGFLYGDVAIASLDTHASGIPTWALLFSALPAPATSGPEGTGYHVNLLGYGAHGNASTGAASGSDFRRRAAENMLGALTSLERFESFLFGAPPSGLTQNLYFLDFDDPLRGAPGASSFDFNAFRDDAAGPNEGMTAAGDSGGPLILDDTFEQQVVIGLLSGGYTRFFSGQPANGYGTVSFYQPLYLYWDWIAANNVYHYVSAVAGDGDWEDPTHWVANLDPNYQIIGPDGQLLNGVPDALGEANAGASGGFGEICFESGGVSECEDASIGNPSAGAPQALPTATLENGLPGATNFTPVNFDGDRLTRERPRYFDVTLSADGATTLSSSVTIDAFAITGPDAALEIAETGALHSLTTYEQWAGVSQVDGALRVDGDYLLFSGLLSGGGFIETPFLTSVMGAIAPGGLGTAGVLTVRGNVILASGSGLLIDVGPNGQSDLLAVEATAESAGSIDLGGALGFALVDGYVVGDGDSFTIVTAEGGVTGAFDTAGSISAILSALVSYEPNAVLLSFAAGDYADVPTLTDPVQRSYAALLDQNRSRQDALADLYGPLDLQSAATIAATLDGLAPAGETTLRAMGMTAMETNSRYFRGRLAGLDPADMDGSVSVLSQVQLAEIAQSDFSMATGMQTLSDATSAGTLPARLPRTMRAYLAAGHIDGESASMMGLTGASRDSYDGWFGAAGLESRINSQAAVGLALSYSNLEGQSAFGEHRVDSELLALTAYGNYTTGRGWALDGQFSLGLFDNNVARDVLFLGATQTLRADDDTMAFAAEAGLSRPLALGREWTLTPRVSMRASQIYFSDVTETGGVLAMTYDRKAVESVQTRFGGALEGALGIARPYVSGAYVHEFEDRAADFGANFAGGVGPNARFALNGDDKDWFELGAGLSVSRQDWSFSLGVETEQGRSDMSSDLIRGGMRMQIRY